MRPVLPRSHLPAVPGVSRKQLGGRPLGAAGAIREECLAHRPALQPKIPSCQQPARLEGEAGLPTEGKLAPEAPVRSSHTQRWPRRGSSQGPLMSDRGGSLGTGRESNAVSQTRVQIPPLPLPECVALGKSLSLFKPPFPPPGNGEITVNHATVYEKHSACDERLLLLLLLLVQ